jgi:glycosyltransferase involved in cell wall biosynthesis
MKILFITPFNLFPPYWGGGTRTYNLLKHLAKKHEILLVYPSFKQFKDKDPEDYKKELAGLGIKMFEVSTYASYIQYINPLFAFKCLELIAKENVDLVFCDYPWSGIYTIILNLLTKKRFVFFEHNVEHLVKSQIGAKYATVMKTLESALSRRASAVITVCDIDKEKVSKFGPVLEKTFVLENGFDERLFYPDATHSPTVKSKLNTGADPLILFFGKLDYPPNKEAVYKIFFDIMPKVLKRRPDAKFVVVGGGYAFDLEHESLIFTGLVEDIAHYINASEVVIAPLLNGGGTKIKILEAIACGKTVITTSRGAEGLVNEYTEPFLKIADDWEAFADYIVEHLNNGAGADTPNRGFIQRYSWSRIYEQMDEILEKIVVGN